MALRLARWVADHNAGVRIKPASLLAMAQEYVADGGFVDWARQVLRGDVKEADLLAPLYVHVPSLAQAPDAMLSNVYVFKNGLAGSGPLNFQADVFENTPDDSGYTPLRKITFVTWKKESLAKEVKSAAEIHRAGAGFFYL